MAFEEHAGAIAHVLDRAAYGPDPHDWRRVGESGVEEWLRGQLRPAEVADDEVEAKLAALPTLDQDVGELLREYPPPQLARRLLREDEEPDPQMIRRLAARSLTPLRELAAARMIRAVASRRQLLEVLTDFWLNHFNVFALQGQVRYLISPYEREAIRPHVLGRFRDMLGAVARSPAMLVYLDNARSGAEPGRDVAGPPAGPRPGDAVEDAVRQIRRRRDARRRGARAGGGGDGEGGPQRGGVMDRRRRGPAFRRPEGLNENYARELMELHTLGVDGGYTQSDVREVARAFTGWSLALGADGAGFRFRADWHDAEEKVVLGHRLPAGRGIEDGEEVLDLLAAHPSTARFLAGTLARRFVADDPPPALVERVADAFTESGGDLRATTEALLLSDEFLGERYRGAKVKSPLEFLASAARALEIEPGTEGRLARALARLGAPLYGASPPTGYPDTAEEWTSANALLARMEVGGLLAGAVLGVGGTPGGRIPGGRTDEPLSGRVDALLSKMLPGRDTGDLHGRIVEWAASRDTPPDDAEIAALVLGSPEFQRR